MDTSEKLFEQAQKVMPGGVNSPVRAYRAVGMTPRFIQSAKGAYITDVDGVQYIDYVGSWGPMILGHANPQVLRAVEQTMKNGLSFGAPTERETDLANLVVSMVPNIEMVRMVNSGTEAVMSAVRVARGATGKDKIIKFEGCYHGHSDAMLVKAGSGALTGVFLCAAARQTEARDDLVKNQQRMVFVTQCAQTFQEALCRRHNAHIRCDRLDNPVTNFAGAKSSDVTRYAEYFRHMLAQKIYLAPAQFEAMFVDGR